MNYKKTADALKKIIHLRKSNRFFLTAIASIGFAGASMAQNLPSYVPANGLVGWWPFNGNANDESGKGNNGTVNGATLTTDRFGNANQAYDFDGLNDYINFINNKVPTGINERTISIWFKVTSIPQDQRGYYLYSQGTITNYASGNSHNLVLIKNNLAPTGPVYLAYTASHPEEIHVNFNPDFTKWYHLTGVFKNGQAKLYLNSNLISQLSVPSWNTIGSDFIIGSRADLNDFCQGQLDDIGIWNRALTDAEIKNLYNGNICYQYITVTDTLLINTGINSFNPVKYNNTIKVYPNPAKTHITIDYGNFASMNGYKLKIQNSIGQQVFQTAISQQSNYLDLSSWGGNGMYFVHIIDPQGNTIDIRKIVLQ